MRSSKRIVSFLTCFVITVMVISPSFVAHASISFSEGGVFGKVTSWLIGTAGFDAIWGTDHSDMYAANKGQNYYTTPTETVEDKYGNVTNYYRGGDTTSTKIIDSYNHTFNTIHNTTNNTNNYSANVKLSDFLNTYTTNNNNYTYNTKYNSWYYDNTQNTYSYDASQTYYNTDNSQYYISIDNSTDEYYLVDVQYAPNFVTVNYNYYNIDNSTTYGDVTNVYYFELTDGRNSADLTADEVAGLDLGYDVVNYQLVTDDPNTLSLQHFDGDYTDSSSYGHTFYSENRSTNYVDSGEFGQALQLPSGSAAGVTIPGLSDYSSLSFDFRIYYTDISKLGIYLGDTNLFVSIPNYRSWWGSHVYDDTGLSYVLENVSGSYSEFQTYSSSDIGYTKSLSSSFQSKFTAPTSYNSSGYSDVSGSKYGYYYWSGAPSLYSSYEGVEWSLTESEYLGSGKYNRTFELNHYQQVFYRLAPVSVAADFSYSTYVNQWVSMRITISGGKLYYFVNGDLVGSGSFTMPSADKFYIKSSGTVYLDELRVTTGDMVSTNVYTPSSEPFDTNKVLALPEVLATKTIYVRHSTPVTSWRIGGVRPSNPTIGFFYIPLYDDYTGGQAQLYDGANWVDVDAVVSDGSTTTSVVGFTFTPMGSSTDVDSDLEPGRPVQPGEDVDQSTCSHTWEETSRVDAICTLAGSVSYTCSKCAATKTETLTKLNHSWEVKQSVQTTYDESGNVLTEGFTIYRCTVCSEEYKDTDGSGPPMVDSSDDSDDDGNWFTNLLKKIGDFFGTTIGGLLELVGTVINNLLDSLITLVSSALDRLTEITGLFGSFGNAIGSLWSWLPEDIVTVLVAGVTVIIFAAVIKLFLR